MNTQHRTASQQKRRYTADPGAWMRTISGNRDQEEANADLIMLKIRTAYELLKSGHATDEHFDRVASAMNVGLMRAELIDPFCEHTINQGIEAMYGCAGIFERHGKYGFTGQGLLAMNSAIDLYESILRMSTPKMMLDASAAAFVRVSKLARGVAV